MNNKTIYALLGAAVTAFWMLVLWLIKEIVR